MVNLAERFHEGSHSFIPVLLILFVLFKKKDKELPIEDQLVLRLKSDDLVETSQMYENPQGQLDLYRVLDRVDLKGVVDELGDIGE